jgi:segregation and condensation protein B
MKSRTYEVGQILGSAALRYRGAAEMGRGRRPWQMWHSRVANLPSHSPTLEDALPAGPTCREPNLAKLEAVLLISRQPQSSRKLAQLTGLADGTKARTLVRNLNRLYDSEGSAFRVEEVGGGFQLLTRPKFAPWLRRLQVVAAEVRLSAPAMETLAVIAYQQPVLRAEIEAIRGVQCGEILRQLIERDLVRIVGRSNELGRPILYGTSRLFLQLFGLRQLSDLPRPQLRRGAGGLSATTKSVESAGGPEQENADLA